MVRYYWHYFQKTQLPLFTFPNLGKQLTIPQNKDDTVTSD